MNSFKTPMIIELVGRQLFKLNENLEYENDKFYFIIHKGFQFDGASIPKSLWSIYGSPFGELFTKASCLHDILYSSRMFDRKTCDKIFHEAMLASGVSMVTAKELYLAVRLFGQSAYDSKNEIAKYRELIEIKIKGME